MRQLSKTEFNRMGNCAFRIQLQICQKKPIIFVACNLLRIRSRLKPFQNSMLFRCELTMQWASRQHSQGRLLYILGLYSFSAFVLFVKMGNRDFYIGTVSNHNIKLCG